MKSFIPYDLSWFELQFDYRVEFSLPYGDGQSFFRIKEWLLGDPDRWGLYKEDWFGHVDCSADRTTTYYRFYFMSKDRAMWFKLAADPH